MRMGVASAMERFLLLLLILSRMEFGVGFAAPRPSSLSYPEADRSRNNADADDDTQQLIELHDEQHSMILSHLPNHNRRAFLTRLVASYMVAGTPLIYSAQSANALPFIGGSDRRQLELCMVTILRTEYWAMTVSKSLKRNLLTPITVDTSGNSTNVQPEMSDNTRKQPYLEARLGAKALLTKKIGGGANSRVRELGGFQIKECLDDAQFWCGELAKTNQLPAQMTGEISPKNAKRVICSSDLNSAAEDLVESLASLVEFDGLETTIDPSPRSTLMLSMYNNQKGTFVYRTLVERVVPSCDRFLRVFGTERRRLVEDFVRRDFGDEVPFEVLEKLYASQQQQ